MSTAARTGTPPISSDTPKPQTAAPSPTQPAKVSAAAELDGSIVGNYKIVKTIGQGTYGKVKLAYHCQTGNKFAIKVIEKAQIQSAKQVARLQREIRFLKLLHHPHIVKVYDVIETSECIFIAMEHVSGGELFDYIVAHKRVKEKESRSMFRMVLSAVEYCHQNSVIHRDLKPENLLLDENKCIKIIDFGFGNNFSTEGLLDTFCGSPFYAAPEMILGKKYEGPEVDMWSLGVILFALLCGHLPFDDDNIKELYKKIASGTYTSPDYLMPNARHLISRLITVDPKKRATLEEVLAHPWVNEGYDSPPPSYLPERPIITDSNHLSKDILNRLLAFGYKTEEINRAFSPAVDQTKPNAIRATYFLLAEMLQREENKVRADRRSSLNPNRERKDSTGSLRPMPGRFTSLSSNNILQSSQANSSLNSIDEQSIRAAANGGSNSSGNSGNTSGSSGNIPHDQPRGVTMKHLEKLNPHHPKEYGSLQAIGESRDRRSSSPDNGRYIPRPTAMSNTGGSASPSSSHQPSSPLANNIQTVETNMANLNVSKVKHSDSKASKNSDDTITEGSNTTNNTNDSSTQNHQATSSAANVPSRRGQAAAILSVSPRPESIATSTAINNIRLSINNSNRPSSAADPSSPASSSNGNSPKNSVVAASQSNSFSRGSPLIMVSDAQSPSTTDNANGAQSAISAVPPSVAATIAANGGGGRRFSMPLNAQIPPRRGSMHKMKEELRAVSGWFLNVSTTSSKSPGEIITEVSRVLTENGVQFAIENNYTIVCEVDMAEPLLNEHKHGKSAKDDASAAMDVDGNNQDHQASSSTSTSPTSPNATASNSKLNSATIAFQIEVCKIPKLTLYGLHFKRLSGGVWNYKKVCNRLLTQMAL